VRFIYRARFKPSGAPYENEYTLFARADEAGIREVFEAMDSLAILDQREGAPIGTTFAKASH
jgi:hypothetical protein